MPGGESPNSKSVTKYAQGLMAKLAPKYIGPYEIMEKKGPNTYSLMDQDGDIEDLIHAEHLKPYFDGKESEEEYNETEPEGTNAETQPPLESDAVAMRDQFNQTDQLPAGAETDQVEASGTIQPRGRGRPRENLQVVKKPTINDSPPASPVPAACEPPKRPRDRPKGSQNRATSHVPVSYSPRRTRANPNPIPRE